MAFCCIRRYITRGDLNAMYQVNPVSLAGKNSVMCFETDGPINATSFFPDLSVFTPVSGSYNINGVPAIKLEYNFTNSGRLNAYSFFISAKVREPAGLESSAHDPQLSPSRIMPTLARLNRLSSEILLACRTTPRCSTLGLVTTCCWARISMSTSSATMNSSQVHELTVLLG